MKEIIDANGHKYVKLEVALRCRHTNRNVVAHDLHGYHRNRLALRGVYLAGHYRRAGLVLGDEYLAKTVSWARCKPTDIVRYLHHITGERLDSAMRKYKLVL